MRIYRLIDHLKASTELNRACVKEIERAHKFQFNPGDVPEDILKGAEQYARQLMAYEIFPMPFDSCVFEFGPSGLVQQAESLNMISGDDWLWVMAWRENDEAVASGWAVYFRAFTHFKRIGGIVPIDGIGQIFTDGGFGKDGQNGYFQLCGVDKQNEAAAKTAAARFGSDTALRKHLLQDAKRMGVSPQTVEETISMIKSDDGRDEFVCSMMDKAFVNLLCVLGLMSTSAGVSIEEVLPKKSFINSVRARKGKALLEYEHKIVKIDPALTRMPGVVALGGSHASPRVHWRRGHIRTLEDGRKVQVKPCIVGDVTRGTITHDYVVRKTAIQ